MSFDLQQQSSDYSTHQRTPDNSSHQLTSVLQSLDTRLSKIEGQLGQQNQQLGQQNNRIHNIETYVEPITVLKLGMSVVPTNLCVLEADMRQIKSK